MFGYRERVLLELLLIKDKFYTSRCLQFFSYFSVYKITEGTKTKENALILLLLRVVSVTKGYHHFRCAQTGVAGRCPSLPTAKAETCSCSSKKIPKNRIKMEWSEECTCCNTDRAPCIPIKTKIQLSGADGFANSPLRPLVSPIVAVRNLLIHNKTSTLNCQP